MKPNNSINRGLLLAAVLTTTAALILSGCGKKEGAESGGKKTNVANIGSDTIMSYTVIGDAVNLGARLESLNKDYGTRIIISEATRSRLKGRYVIHPFGDVVVKGKSKPVAIFEVKTP